METVNNVVRYIVLFLICFTINNFSQVPADSNWSALGSGTNGIVRAITVMGNDIYIGGDFTTAGGILANHIAKWDGTNWSPLGSGTNGSVRALAVSGTDLYVGGSFTIAGGDSANLIAKWDGTNWSSLEFGYNPNTNNERVLALAVLGNEIYAGGYFIRAGGILVRNIAKWNGTSWDSLGSGVSAFTADEVNALTVMGDDLYVGGGFKVAGGDSVNRIAKWDGTNWTALGTGMDNTVLALTVYGNDIYAGGEFNIAGGSAVEHIAKWDGSSWSPPAAGVGVDNYINALAVIGSDLYAGGRFVYAGVFEVNHIARWDGSSYWWWNLGSGVSPFPSDEVDAIAVLGDDLYVGGSFTEIPGDYIAKWNVGSTTSIIEHLSVITNPVLYQNYPNPFNPTTSIKYALPKSEFVSLKVYDILGREITVLVNENKQAGTHTVNWDATGMASGVYLYHLQAGEFVATKRLLLLK